jgi:hypothetical protein
MPARGGRTSRTSLIYGSLWLLAFGPFTLQAGRPQEREVAG